MRTPSVKAIMQMLNIPIAKAKEVKRIITETRESHLLGYKGEYPQTSAWLDDNYKATFVEVKLLAFNELLHGHGVEVLKNDEGHAVVEYVNMGDTYDNTVVFNADTGRFTVESWGNFFERNERKLRLV